MEISFEKKEKKELITTYFGSSAARQIADRAAHHMVSKAKFVQAVVEAYLRQ